MSEKPEALVIADELDAASLGIKGCLEALSAAELRRLHAENERLREALIEAREDVESLGPGLLLDRIDAALRREETT